MNKWIDIEKNFRFLDETERYDIFLTLYDSKSQIAEKTFEEVVKGPEPLNKLIFLRYLEEIPEVKAVSWILQFLNDSNKLVRDAAKSAFQKNHNVKKNMVLRKYIFSADPDVARFAIWSLAKKGAAEVVPNFLMLLMKSAPPQQRVILKALKYVPDERAIPDLLAFLQKDDITLKFEALRTLADLSRRFKSIPSKVFVQFFQAPEERFRRVALSALQNYASQKVADTLLTMATHESSLEIRGRAIQALVSFPQERLVLPLVFFMTGQTQGSIRLFSETTLKQFPLKILKKGLLPLLDHTDLKIRHQSALLLAQLMGQDPAVSQRLIQIWNSASKDTEKMALIEMFREIEGPTVPDLVFECFSRSPVLAYSAASVIGRFWTEDTNRRILALIQDETKPSFVRQALVDVFVKWEPHEAIQPALFSWLSRVLTEDNINLKYVCLRIMAWYPFEEALPHLMLVLVNESDPNIQILVYEQIIKRLGSNPAPLLDYVRQSNNPHQLIPHMMNVLAHHTWKKSFIPSLIQVLLWDPFYLGETDPDGFFRFLIPCLEKQKISFSEAWNLMATESLRDLFLKKLVETLTGSSSMVSFIPPSFFKKELKWAKGPRKILLFQLMQHEPVPGLVSAVVKALLHETDPRIQSSGKLALSQMIWRASL